MRGEAEFNLERRRIWRGMGLGIWTLSEGGAELDFVGMELHEYLVGFLLLVGGPITLRVGGEIKFFSGRWRFLELLWVGWGADT